MGSVVLLLFVVCDYCMLSFSWMLPFALLVSCLHIIPKHIVQSVRTTFLVIRIV